MGNDAKQLLLDQVVVVIWQWLGCSNYQFGFMPA
jgi:hypothetical protein